jgi:hypothetical protein
MKLQKKRREPSFLFLAIAAVAIVTLLYFLMD